eukprot:jgi/Astpho2/6016/Aster-03973
MSEILATDKKEGEWQTVGKGEGPSGKTNEAHPPGTTAAQDGSSKQEPAVSHPAGDASQFVSKNAYEGIESMPSKSASGIMEEDVPVPPPKGTQRRANGQDGRWSLQSVQEWVQDNPVPAALALVAVVGTGFPYSERERLAIRGLLPPKVLSLERQARRVMEDYLYGRDYIDPSHVKDGGVTPDDTRKWKVLQELQDRNETLFYHLLVEHFVDMCRIIYTPTVGWACLNYHRLYRRPRGMYFSAADKGEMAAMIWNWHANDVDAIVVTDGSRILGLGDLGVNGLGISVGKLDLYVGAAGFHPRKVLPCVLDVGTNNEQLRKDPMYMGLDQARLEGDEYYQIVDEFMSAVSARWPHAVIQFEDFQLKHAHPLLQRYRHHHLMWNDDIQGTAATALAGIYGALTVQGKPLHTITQQQIVVIGAGSAGMGVTYMIAQAMVKHGLTFEEATHHFWILDANGLITRKRSDITSYVQPFARDDDVQHEGESLEQVVKRVKPTILIGLAGAGKLFTENVLKAMGELNERPIIFAMSNPTYRSECTAEEAQVATGGRAIFASGSPYPDCQIGDRTIACSQANNMYIFPDMMLTAAAEALPALIPKEDLEKGVVYPPLRKIREISQHVAMDVIKIAAEDGHVHNSAAIKALAESDEALLEWISSKQFIPRYQSVVKLPTGVME